MEYKKLGKSGALVSKLCLGYMNFGMVTDRGRGVSYNGLCPGLRVFIFLILPTVYGGYDTRGLTETILGAWFAEQKKRGGPCIFGRQSVLCQRAKLL